MPGMEIERGRATSYVGGRRVWMIDPITWAGATLEKSLAMVAAADNESTVFVVFAISYVFQQHF
jgi:hypothetical protein